MKWYMMICVIPLLLAGCFLKDKQSENVSLSTIEPVQPAEEVTNVFISQNEIIYDGGLDANANAKVIDLYNKNKSTIDTIVIDSPGGEISLGMDLGDFIFDNGLNVKVNTLCFSSCANYLFPSGKTKYLKNNAFVGYHGSAASKEFGQDPSLELTEEQKAQLDEYLKEMSKREAAFYKKRNIDPRLPVLGQNGNYDNFEDYIGWYYKPETMKLLGLQNIEVNDPPWFYDPTVGDAYKLFEIPIEDIQPHS